MSVLTLRRSFLATLLLAAVALPSARTAMADPDAVRGLIESRLAVMKDVAAFKHLRGVAVQDLEREAVVLKKAVEGAAAKGLVPETVTPFFRAQIEAAKAIQHCWIARWQDGSAAAPDRAPDLKTEVRPKLVEIGGKLVASIAETPATAMPIEAAPPALDCLPDKEAGDIASALAGVRKAQ